MKFDKGLVAGSSTLLVLSLLEGGDMYGYQMIEELSHRSSHVFQMKEGTLYPILHGLEKEKYLSAYEQQATTGRQRKYYRLTRRGRKLLDEKRDAFDPRAFLAPIMDTVMYGTGDEGAVALITDAMRRGVKEAVGTLIVEFGSYGKAPLVEPATLEDMAARYAKEG